MRYLTAVVLLFVCLPHAFAQISTIAQPLHYPAGVVSTQKPYFIWCDIYNTDVKPFVILLTVKNSTGHVSEFTLTPRIIDSVYCVVEMPSALEAGTYTYTIQLLINNKPSAKRYYHYKRYPVEGSFTIDMTKHNPVDALDAQGLVYFLSQSRANTLHNGYNALFFSTSGTISTGAGIAVYYLTNFGIVTAIISATAVTSGIIGISAGIYYGIKYHQNNKRIQAVLDNAYAPEH